jgi:hypothetical protein
MDAKTHEHARAMLRRQGALLDKWLEQNLGTRYAFVILAMPDGDGVQGMHCIHNLRESGIAERLLTDFARQLHVSEPPYLTPNATRASA